MEIWKLGARVSCSGCSQPYSTRDVQFGRGSRLPLLLACGHTLCEPCVLTALVGDKNSVACPICSSASLREHKDANVNSDFPLSIFVLGVVIVRQWTRNTGDSQVTFAQPGANKWRSRRGRSVEAAPPQNATPDLCEECTSKPCDCFCQQCELKYCSVCFAKVHKAKALAKHVKVPPPVGKVKLLEKQLCQNHKDKSLEFHCKDCKCSICAHCFFDSHRVHDVISLLEKNKEYLETLDEMYEKGTKVLKQLLFTQKKVEGLRQASPKQQGVGAAPYARVEQEVAQHFSRLHGLLQLEEQRLLGELAEARGRHVDGLRSVAADLAASVAEARDALEAARVVKLPANLALADMATVGDRLAALLDRPCHLVTNATGDADSVRFIVEDSFGKNLASHCRLELQSSVNYALTKFEDLPTDYVVEPLDDALLDDVGPPMTPSSRASSVSAIGEEPSFAIEQQQQQPQPQPQPQPQRQPQSQSQSELKQQKSQSFASQSRKVMQFAYHERQDNVGPNNTHPVISIALDPANRKKAKNILKGTSEAVVVTHIKDPGDFYVQLESDQHKMSVLSGTYKKIAVSSTIPTEVKPGEIYLVCYKTDNNWYRGRAVSLVPTTDPQTEQQVLVQYIDFGNSEKVSLSSFRVAPKTVLQPSFMAIHCGLHGIYPVGNKWTSESVKLFAQMVNSSVVMMVVLGHTVDKYEVDLCRIPTGGDDVPSSVQEAMVFLGCAHYFNDQGQVKHVVSKPNPFFSEKTGMKHGDIIDVTVTHVDSPSSFCVIKVDESYVLMNVMMEKLQEEYSIIGNKGLVYTPYLNLPCAATYSLDKKWYRAMVIDLPGNRLVRIKYVDFGNTELVSWNKIRKLGEEYMQLPAQAIHCSLNDVVPPQEWGNKWMAKAGNFLQQCTASQITRMFVDKASSDVLKVTLYLVKPNVDICINALMVREGLARSTGVSSSLVEFHKSVDDVQNKKLKIPPLLKGAMGMNAIGAEKKQLLITSLTQDRQLDDDDAEGDDNEEEEDEEKKGPLKVEVRVLSVVNPSRMYVSIVSQHKAVNSMMEEMQEFYQHSPKIDRDWVVGDHCAAYLKDKKLWYRSVILELADSENAKLFLKDTADCVLVEIQYLRELSNLFTQLHSGAIRCHLAGIKPAGSTSSWSILATEFLTTLVSQDNIFSIVKKGEVENDSLPVELLVKEIVEEGPLTPTVEEWRSINNKLVEQGLAFAVLSGSTSSNLSAGQQLLKGLNNKHVNTDDVIVTQWSTNQKSGRLAGPCKSPRKLLTSYSNDQSITAVGKTAKSEGCTAEKKPNLSDSMVVHASGTESDDASEVQELANSPPLFDSWLPANPLPSQELWVVPTYVDMKCCLYFHDCLQEDTLTVIGNGLNSRFCNSKPKPYDSYWSPGQTCVALYHSDKKWYRGQVISIKEDMTVEVMFVDYGNVETCKASELRKDVCMTHIPVQCHAAKLYGVAPLSEDGLWPEKTLDFIHLTVVEKRCFVKLRTSPTTHELLVTSLMCPGNLDLYQLLVNMQYCVLTYISDDADSDGSDAVYIEAQTNADDDVIVEDVTENVATGIIVSEGQVETVGCKTIEEQVALALQSPVTERLAAGEREQDVCVKDEVQSVEDRCRLLDVTAARASVMGDVGVNDKGVIKDLNEEGQHVGKEDDDAEGSVRTNEEGEEDIVSAECSSSCSTDESEQQLSRKPQSLMDWYDIITEEEKKTNVLGDEYKDNENERIMFHAMELPELDNLLVEVTAILSVNEVVLHLLKTETTELRMMKSKFEELTRILQDEAADQDVLCEPFIGQPCCACYSEDTQWYRAMIVDMFDDKQLKIAYVDYGNTEVVSPDCLHEMKREWLELPVQGVQARLWRVEEAPNQDHQAVIQRLSESLFKPPVIAQIQSRTPLTVQILCSKTSEPVYKSLFDDGLLIAEL